MKTVMSFIFVGLIAFNVRAGSWQLDSSIGSSFNTWAGQTGVNPVASALVAASATELYTVVTWVDGGGVYATLLKWTPSGGWVELPNAHVYLGAASGVIHSISYVTQRSGPPLLFIGGTFDGFAGLSWLEVRGVARYSIDGSGTWMGVANNLRATGITYALKAATWGSESTGYRTYLYVGGEVLTVGSSTSCANVARGYLNGSSWTWESLNGGIPNVSGLEGSKVWTLDVNPTHSNDMYYGNRHRLFVGGEFTKAGASTTATNVAYWTENTAAWSAMGWGVSRMGMNQSCALYSTPFPNGRVQSLSQVGGNAYVVGQFNHANTSYVTVPDAPCPFLAPLGLATISTGGSLGMWGGNAAWHWQSPQFEFPAEAELWGVAGASTNVFVAAGLGAIIETASSTAAPAFRVHGSTWDPIDANVPGYPSTTEYLRAATAGSSSGFFLVNDSNGYRTFRRYYYQP